MRVLLIDVDSKIPNLAMMKISNYHREREDIVGFNIGYPDKVYASVVFTKNRHKIDGLRYFYPDAEIDIGGTGYDVLKKLPSEIDQCSPDYSIYPNNDRYIGFTTRGCIRKCPFCFVPRKEGRFRRLFDTPAEALDHIKGNGQYKAIELLDNNILADKDWFMELSQEIIDRKLKVDFNQGLDIRLLDSEIAEIISDMKSIGVWKFAFDNSNYQDHVLKGIEILRSKGINVHHKCLFYVYCSGDESYEDAVYRCRVLKEHDAQAYLMVNPEGNITKRVKELKRWTRPWIYWSIDIDAYKGGN